MSLESSSEQDEDFDTFKFHGRDCLNENRNAEAAHWFSRAICRDPDNVMAYYYRCLANYRMKRFKEAIADGLHVVSLNPGFVQVYRILGKSCFMLSELEKALHYYNMAAISEINPEISGDVNLIRICQDYVVAFDAANSASDFSKVLYYSKLLVQEVPEHIKFHLMYVEALLFNKRVEEALQLLTDIIGTSEQIDEEILYMRAKAMFYCGISYISQAISFIQVLLERCTNVELQKKAKKLLLECELVQSLKSEGNEHFAKSQWNDAISCYKKALEVDPRNYNVCAVLYNNSAAAHKESGMYQEAITDCTKAITLCPTYDKAYLRRARTYVCMRQFDCAVSDYEIILQKLNPHCQEAFIELREAKILQQQQQQRFDSKQNTSCSELHGIKNWYAILGVQKDADDKQIRRAYREQALKLHPDKASADCDEEQKQLKEKKFKEVGEAYDTLRDPVKRSSYDQSCLIHELRFRQQQHQQEKYSFFLSSWGHTWQAFWKSR